MSSHMWLGYFKVHPDVLGIHLSLDHSNSNGKSYLLELQRDSNSREFFMTISSNYRRSNKRGSTVIYVYICLDMCYKLKRSRLDGCLYQTRLATEILKLFFIRGVVFIVCF